ncbi:DUF2634 domain-containing protein [Shouchella lehensis]|uniref:DUF2634 domain-containing protein n=1 Tax=Shouchella lehensis TaxID=300825 RepID=A0A4Y7WEE3_9BACI|nr:DUF2634 domain-containing protein [Shouchella lehensis]MBG9783593.1 hypothetical protein [Shouchella lehensis]TES45649.1 DUF2634 domain-containing protein [Shouchella lehensis]
MKTLKLKDGDLCLENNEFQMVEGDQELAQSLKMVYQTRKGEFDLDRDHGLERENLLGKAFDEELLRYDVVEATAQEERISAVEDMSVVDNLQTRQRQINLVLQKEDQETLRLEGVDLA